MTPETLKHLDYIQQTISRMVTLSFQIKAWNIALVTAVLAFAAGDKNPVFLWVAYLPSLMLWGLDTFYLRQEWLYRALYNDVRQPDSKIDPFSMNTDAYKRQDEMQFATVFRSPTLKYFHGTILLVVILAMCFVYFVPFVS